MIGRRARPAYSRTQKSCRGGEESDRLRMSPSLGNPYMRSGATNGLIVLAPSCSALPGSRSPVGCGRSASRAARRSDQLRSFAVQTGRNPGAFSTPNSCHDSALQRNDASCRKPRSCKGSRYYFTRRAMDSCWRLVAPLISSHSSYFRHRATRDAMCAHRKRCEPLRCTL
jgi:hypothetical protein